MSGYVKLFGSILDSSIMDEPVVTRWIWTVMLAMKNADGEIEASVGGLARRACVDRADAEEALRAFLSPDPDSRTKDNDGKRIEEIDGGWRVLNHEKYRELMSKEDIREKNAERQRRWRNKNGVTDCHADNVTVTEDNAGHDISEEEPQSEGSGCVSPQGLLEGNLAGARSNESASMGPFHQRPRVFLAACTPAFLSVYDRYPRKEGKQPAAQVFQELAERYPGGENALARTILIAFDAGMLTRAPYNGPNSKRTMLDRFLAERRWEDAVSAPDDVAPPKPSKPWLEADKAKERLAATDRAARRLAQENIDRLIAGEKAVG